MYFANFPLYILFFAAIYLISIYGLLLLAQMLKKADKIIVHNPPKTKNQIRIP